MTSLTMSVQLKPQYGRKRGCDMTKITIDKGLIEQAIADLEHISTAAGQVEFIDRTCQKLREALAEPAPEPAAEIYAPSYLPRAIGLRFTHYGTTLPAGTKLYAAPVRELAPPPPADVPRISKEHCSLAERKKHQFSVNFPSDDLYCPRCLCSERFLQSKQCEPHIVYDAPSLPSPPSPPPADVPLLTQDDIVQIILSSKHLPLGDAIRLTEKVVRQKAGL